MGLFVFEDKAFLAALRQEYAAAHNGKMPLQAWRFWRFAAEYIADQFCNIDDDSFFEWANDLVDKHITPILADFPELANDESSFAYQGDKE